MTDNGFELAKRSQVLVPSSAYIAGVLLILMLPPHAFARVSFSTTEQTESIGVANPQAIRLADLDGDGLDDLITVADLDAVAVYLNDGEGNLDLDAEYDTIGEAPVAVATGSFNGDSFRDIVTVNQASGTISVFLGLGDGTLDEENDPRQFVVGQNPIGIGVGDFNNDLLDDLAVLSPNLVYLLQGNGDGTFSAFNPATISTRGVASFAIAVGFLDSDTNLDFAVTNRGNALVVTFFGNGNSTFKLGQLLGAGDSPTGIVIADVDGDQANDILAVDAEALPFDEVRLLRNIGEAEDSLFGEPESIVSAERPLAITALDIEPDGKVDLAVTTVEQGEAALLCQPSGKCDRIPNEPLEPVGVDKGIFRQPRGGTLPGCTEDGQVAIVSGKLNADEMDDLVALSGDLDTLCIMLNTSTVDPPRPTPTVTQTPASTPTPTVTRTATATPTRKPGSGGDGCTINQRSSPPWSSLLLALGCAGLLLRRRSLASREQGD